MEPGKYARIERERRFLVDALPPIEPTADRHITDLYLDGARMRVRLSVAVDGAVIRKLTQKIPAPDGSPHGVQGWITNTYLSEAEYELFAALPGRWLRKRRLSIGEIGVDLFEGGLAGLILAEAEFTNDDDLHAFVPPTWCGAEVTSDPAFRGATLASRPVADDRSADPWQHGDVAAFAEGEEVWVRRLGNLRNTVRQDVIRRQLAEHVRAPMTVLDVGCGQGTQAIALAAAGCAVTGVEPSAALRELCERSASEAGVGVELLDGSVDSLPGLIGGRRFDVVCAHGLLMYLADRTAAIATLAACVADDGALSVTFRNGHALAMRPALRGDWTGALAALEGARYVNELGVEARADRLDDVTADLAANGLDVVAWYGVRVLNDAVDPDTPPPDDHRVLAALLDAEHEAGRRDPYRWLGSQLHVVARRR